MSDTKLTILLAVALFMISAPEPDSATIAEMSANFVVPANERALLASEPEAQEALARELAVSSREVAPRASIGQANPETSDGEGSVGPG